MKKLAFVLSLITLMASVPASAVGGAYCCNQQTEQCFTQTENCLSSCTTDACESTCMYNYNTCYDTAEAICGGSCAGNGGAGGGGGWGPGGQCLFYVPGSTTQCLY